MQLAATMPSHVLLSLAVRLLVGILTPFLHSRHIEKGLPPYT
jgi:hypothetical protein